MNKLMKVFVKKSGRLATPKICDTQMQNKTMKIKQL